MGSTLPASRDEDAQLLLDKVGSVRAGGGPPWVPGTSLQSWPSPPPHTSHRQAGTWMKGVLGGLGARKAQSSDRPTPNSGS